MSILQINYTDHADNAEKAFANHKLKWTPPFSDSFLDHVLPILASVKLETKGGKVSASDTFMQLKHAGSVQTPNGLMDATNVMALIRMLYFTKRSALLSASQIRAPRFASFTPLMLYAHKLYNDVPYSSWIKDDKYLGFFLGNTLDLILEVKDIPDLTIDEVIKYRQEALTYKTGKNAGTQAPAHTYKCVLTTVREMPLPKPAIMMLLQIWLAHASVRNTESMILDPLDWDNIPDALDAVEPLPVLSVADRKAKLVATKGDTPWN
jgi:hypothetical protein